MPREFHFGEHYVAVCRHSPLKKVNLCRDGGYVKLQDRLLQGNRPECAACIQLLVEQKFDGNWVRLNLSDDEGPKDDPEILQEKPDEKPDEKTSDEESDGEQKGPRAQKKSHAKRGKRKLKQVSPEENSTNCRAVAEEYLPDITLLPRGSLNKKVPYRCTLCRAVKQPYGKVGECGKWRPYAIRYFLEQHVESGLHQQMLILRGDIQGEVRDKVKCEGISMNRPLPGSQLHLYQKEFELWASYANLESTAVHKYWKDMTSNCWYVRSAHCTEETEEDLNRGWQMCGECTKLLKSKSIVRSPQRFARKFYAAKLLQAKLFLEEQDVDAVEKEIKELTLFQRGTDELCDLVKNYDLGSLQAWVRGSCLCDSFSSPLFKDFVSMAVIPSLRVNVFALPERMQKMTHQITLALESGNLWESF